MTAMQIQLAIHMYDFRVAFSSHGMKYILRRLISGS